MASPLQFVQLQSLHEQTLAYLQNFRTLTVVMPPAVATKRKFNPPQSVGIHCGGTVYPGMLMTDRKLKLNLCIVDDGITSGVIQRHSKEGIVIKPHCPWLFAEQVILTTLEVGSSWNTAALVSHLKETLVSNRYPLKAGMNFVFQHLCQELSFTVKEVKYFGFDKCDFSVAFCCLPGTEIMVEEPENPLEIKFHTTSSFEQVGGYQEQVQIIKSSTEKLFSGSSPSKPEGILIAGPHGSGKSMFGDVLRTEYPTKFIGVDASEIKSKFRGEAEANLQKVFRKASGKAPCIVFIDDIDLICSACDSGGNAGVVTSLLHLLDGVDSRTSEGILAIGTATNSQRLDPALRRPGRLSVDVVLSSLDCSSRVDVISKMLKRVTNDLTDADAVEVANMTAGYVAGDLRALFTDAVMKAAGQVLTREHLLESLKKVKPSSLKEVIAKEHQVSLQDVCGYKKQVESLRNSLDLVLNFSHIFHRACIPLPSRMLLFGPPGCGKTMIVSALANHFKLRIIPIKRANIFGKYFGESEQNLSKAFSQARALAPCMLLFENFDGLAKKRKSDGGSEVEARVISHLKVHLDGIVANEGIVVVAETNRPDLLDKDVIRQGRFHTYVYVGLPSSSDRLQLITKLLSSWSLDSSLSTSELADLTQDFTMAEIQQFCDELKTQALDQCTEVLSDASYPLITADHLKETLDVVVLNTSPKMIQKYSVFTNMYCSGS